MGYFGILSNTKVFNNTLLEYVFAIFTTAIVFVIIPILWSLFKKYLTSIVGVTKPDMKELFVSQINKFNTKIFLIAAIYIGATTLNLPPNIFLVIKGILFALVGIQFAIILGPLIEPILKRFCKLQDTPII